MSHPMAATLRAFRTYKELKTREHGASAASSVLVENCDVVASSIHAGPARITCERLTPRDRDQ